MELLALLAPFAPVAVVPLGLSLTEVSAAAKKLHVPAAALAAASFAFQQGPIAAALVLPWLAFTLFVGWRRVRRWLARGTNPVEEFAVDAGFLYLALGGFWLVVSRFGARPLGFTEKIVLLTAIHFHYAGFAACVFTAMTGRALGERAESAIYRWSAWAVIAGTPALAVGITLSRWVELFAAFYLALGVAAISGLALVAARLARAGIVGRLCISAAAASTVISMSMAAIYALGEFAKAYWLMIPEMAVTHGTANAIGFGFIGLIGWLLIRPRRRFGEDAIPFSKLYGERRVGAGFFERIGAAEATREVTGLTDDFREYGIEGISPLIRDFYEHTAHHDLRVKAKWSPLFRIGGKLFLWWAHRIGQLDLPTGAEEMETRVFALSAEVDGRPKPRAWVRTRSLTGDVIYAAAYSSHRDTNRRYMNIAFPLPGGNMTSILHLSGFEDGVVLTTRWRACPGGQQGVYYANWWNALRLPLDETIWVSSEGSRIVARHDMWVCGIRYLRLDYEITKRKR